MLEAQSPSRNAADEIFGPPVTESAVMESVRLGSEPESFGTQVCTSSYALRLTHVLEYAYPNHIS
jgi:hypothetical protein